ncbi:MAG: hypothetical protein K9N51_11235 [Candidatus Pacebacteria bacterium]|nr:hypothetical protein [Candidatus Paceibacterota bacterium]
MLRFAGCKGYAKCKGIDAWGYNVTMLIATDKRVYHVSPDVAGGTPESLGERDRIQAVTQSRLLGAVATTGGRIECWRNAAQYFSLEIDIQEKITSMLVLDANLPVLLIGTEPPHIWIHISDGFPAYTQGNINTHHVTFA